MISKETLKKYANDLMFDMNDSEYETLQKEFETITKQMDLIEEMHDIKGVEPMTFPYANAEVLLREDTDSRTVDNEEAFSNCHGKKGRDVKVPRVVE